MPALYVPYISGQYSGLDNDMVLTADKHNVVFNRTFNQFGKCVKRAGSTVVNDLGSGDVLGMHDAGFEDGTHVLLATVGTQVFNALTGSAFGAQTFTAAKKMEFAGFLNLVFVANGQDAMGHFNSSGTFATTNTVGAPVADCITRYGARIWANDVSNRRRVHRSTVPSGGTISWNTATEFFDVEGSGDLVTALHAARNTLMVFTNDDVEIRYYNRARLGQLTGVGTLSKRSILTVLNKTYWFHHDAVEGFAGIMEYSGTGEDSASLVSTPLQDVFDAMPDDQNDQVVAWVEGASIVWYLGGDVEMPYGTVNCVVLNLKNSGWSVWYLPYAVLAATRFLNGSSLERRSYVGDAAATVRGRYGTSDDGEAIHSFLQKTLTADDPFLGLLYRSLAVKGDGLVGVTVSFWTNKEDHPETRGLEPHPSGKNIVTAKLDKAGSDLTIRISSNDDVVDSIRGYRVKFDLNDAED